MDTVGPLVTSLSHMRRQSSGALQRGHVVAPTDTERPRPLSFFSPLLGETQGHPAVSFLCGQPLLLQLLSKPASKAFQVLVLT